MQRFARFVAQTVLIVVVLQMIAPAGARAATYTLCDAAAGSSPTVPQADALLDNRYPFSPYPTPTWLRALADEHGNKLAASSFYLKMGNRALDQNIGLLDIGCARHNSTWKSVAVSRIDSWSTSNVDAQGVSAEQSDGYNLYVFKRLDLAIQQLNACGITPSSTVSGRR